MPPPRVGSEAWATISRIWRLSSTTTAIRLNVDLPRPPAPPFTFEPGQWVDFHIPSIQQVGGYSITSLPSELPSLDLAIKASAHPPAAWCTGQAKEGERVALRVGGSFVLRETRQAALFIAGGVGINPLYSMLRELCVRPAAAPKLALLYRARTRDELLFSSELHAIARQLPERTRFWLGATREAGLVQPVAAAPGVPGYADGRVGQAELEIALQWLGCEPNAVRPGQRAVPWRAGSQARVPGSAGGGCASGELAAYVCGPPRMTDETTTALWQMGVADVYSERWW